MQFSNLQHCAATKAKAFCLRKLYGARPNPRVRARPHRHIFATKKLPKKEAVIIGDSGGLRSKKQFGKLFFARRREKPLLLKVV